MTQKVVWGRNGSFTFLEANFVGSFVLFFDLTLELSNISNIGLEFLDL
jgi:hypothetical protein